ncbi:oligosaccharide flippase family protein [Halorubrum miltondacostae]|uniref:Oligosaccharide flippase family protein n=1 Tax=Halorubrum miltondacostae TaxID=3076378 RepID=A0ABD5M6R8_9EURY
MRILKNNSKTWAICNMERSLTTLISISLTGALIGKGFDYSINLIIARSIGPEALGIFSFGLVVVNLLSNISQSGLDNAAQKFIAKYRSQNRPNVVTGIVLFTLLGGLIAGSTITLIFYAVVRLDLLPGTRSISSPVLLFVISVPLFATMRICTNITHGFKQTKYAVYIDDFAKSGVAIILCGVSIITVSTVEGVILGYILAVVIANITGVYSIWKLGGFNQFFSPVIKFREIITLSLPSTVINITQYTLNMSGILLLGIFKGSETVGFFQASLQNALLLTFLLLSVNSIFPTLASEYFYDDKIDTLRETYNTLTKWMLYLCFMLYIYIIVFSSEILTLFGSGFTRSATPLIILGFGTFAMTVIGPAGQLLLMTGYERLEALNTAISCALAIILGLLLIPNYGLLGASASTALAMFSLSALRLVQVHFFYDIQPYDRHQLRTLGTLLLSGGILIIYRRLDISLVPKLILGGILLVLPFLIQLSIYGIDESDRKLIQNINDI